jgi:phage terminase small subunit
MGQRGPNNTNIKLKRLATQDRIKIPVKGISKEARKIVIDVVESKPPSYFELSDLGNLIAYGENLAILQKSVRMIAEHGEVVTNKSGFAIRSPWISIFEKATGSLVNLSKNLRIIPLGRLKQGEVVPAEEKKISKRDFLQA